MSAVGTESEDEVEEVEEPYERRPSPTTTKSLDMLTTALKNSSLVNLHQDLQQP